MDDLQPSAKPSLDLLKEVYGRLIKAADKAVERTELELANMIYTNAFSAATTIFHYESEHLTETEHGSEFDDDDPLNDLG